MDVYQRAAIGWKALNTGYTQSSGPHPSKEDKQSALVEVLRNLMHQADMSRLSFSDALATAGTKHHRDIIADAEQEAADELRAHVYPLALNTARAQTGVSPIA